MDAACQSSALTIYQRTNAAYITDEIIAECDAYFRDAIESAESALFRARVEREYLAIRFLQLTRMEMDEIGRDELIDQFISDVKSFGITEIMERTPLTSSRASMKTSRYAQDRPEWYHLYYIMQ